MMDAKDVSILPPLIHVMCPLMLMVSVTNSGILDSVYTDISLDHYAEKAWPVWKNFMPWVAMPANTFVNLGYVLAGAYWLIAAKKLVRNNGRIDANARLSGNDLRMLYMFGWIGVLYAPVQLSRLLTLSHKFAIMDQWYTLPGFAWAIIWANYLLDRWSPSKMIIITLTSSLSYALALVSDVGFDIALGIHILFVVASCAKVQTKFGTSRSKSSLMKAVLNCAGFVFLKLADHYLPLIHPIFNFLSGHFWSKICDVLQVYYAGEFFFLATIQKAKDSKKTS